MQNKVLIYWLSVLIPSISFAASTPYQELITTEKQIFTGEVLDAVSKNQSVNEAVDKAESLVTKIAAKKSKIRALETELAKQADAVKSFKSAPSGDKATFKKLYGEHLDALEDLKFFIRSAYVMSEAYADDFVPINEAPNDNDETSKAEWRDYYERQIKNVNDNLKQLGRTSSGVSELAEKKKKFEQRMAWLLQWPWEEHPDDIDSKMEESIGNIAEDRSDDIIKLVTKEKLELNKGTFDESAYKKLTTYRDALKSLVQAIDGKLAGKLSKQPVASQLLKDSPDLKYLKYFDIQESGSVTEKYLVDEAIIHDRELNMIEQILARANDIRSNLNKQVWKSNLDELMEQEEDTEKKLERSEATLDALERKLNLKRRESLTTAMRAVTENIDMIAVRNKPDFDNALKEDKPLRIAFRSLMQKLETYEFETAKAYGGLDPYPQSRFWNLWNRGLNEAGFGPPTTTKLTTDYNWARWGQLEPRNRLGGYTQTALDIVKKAWDPVGALRVAREAITDWVAKFQKNPNSPDTFAAKYPLLVRDIAGNILLTYKILSLDRSNPWSDFSGQTDTLLTVSQARNVVVDSLLGSDTFFYSERSSNEPPIPLALLQLAQLAEAAPFAAGAVLGAQGKTTASGLAKFGVGSALDAVGTVLLTVGGVWMVLPVAALNYGKSFVSGTAGVAAGVGEVLVLKMGMSAMSRTSEVWANSLLYAIKGFGQGDPVQAVKNFAKYQIARAALKTFGDVARRLRKGTFTADYLKDFGKCMTQNKGAAITSSGISGVAGIILGGLAITASSPVVAPVLIIGGVTATGCLVATKAWDWMWGKSAKRDEERQLEQLKSHAADIGTEIAKEDGKDAPKSDLEEDERTLKDLLDVSNPETEGGIQDALKLLQEDEKALKRIADNPALKEKQRVGPVEGAEYLACLYQKELQVKIDMLQKIQMGRAMLNLNNSKQALNDFDKLATQNPEELPAAVQRARELIAEARLSQAAKSNAEQNKSVDSTLNKLARQNRPEQDIAPGITLLKDYWSRYTFDQISENVADKVFPGGLDIPSTQLCGG